MQNAILYNGAALLALTLSACATAQTSQEQETEATAPSFSDCENCPQMVSLPTGKAMLGAEPYEANRKIADMDLHDVNVTQAFAIAQTETTLAQYRQFMDETDHEMATDGCNTWGRNRILGYVKAHTWDHAGIPQNEKHPVVCVSHVDATAYADWLSTKTGKPYRLLSSNEFEYAARAGTRGPWFWGSSNKDACEYANVGDAVFRRGWDLSPVFNCDDGYEHTAPVATYKPNAWGIYDLIGNAWEWTDDCLHRNRDNIPTDQSAWLEEDGGECERRMARGGGWVSGTDWNRAAAQSADYAVYHSQLLGFRVALTLPDANKN